MIPLILLALGLGAALTAYELSPRTQSRVDAYVRAIRSASAAHQAADGHLGNANAAASTAIRHTQQAVASRQAAPAPTSAPVPWSPQWVPQWIPTQPSPAPVQPSPTSAAPEPSSAPLPPYDPAPYDPALYEPAPSVPVQVADAQANAAQAAADAAVDHAAAAIEANQAAAQNTAEAAKNAQDEAQRQAAAQSAAKVLEREKKIAAALTSLGVGQCGVRSYPRVGGGALVTERTKNALLAKLRTEGMGVTGDNPWNIDTREYDVKLRAVWDPKAGVVKLIVTSGKGGYFGLVTCEEIWKKIDPIMKEVIG